MSKDIQISEWTADVATYPGAAVSISPDTAEELDRWAAYNDSIDAGEAGGTNP